MPADHTACETRRAVLDTLRAATGPMHPLEVATRLGVHANTVRRHLDILEATGQARRRPEQRVDPGRPRVLYEATEEHCGTRLCDGNRFLARMLTAYVELTHEDPRTGGREAGEAWGRHLVEAEPFHRLDPMIALDRAFAVLDELGYEPSVHTAREGELTTVLGSCPFPELAEAFPDVVCSLHLGLLRGALSQLGSNMSVTAFAPVASGGHCTVEYTVQQHRRSEHGAGR